MALHHTDPPRPVSGVAGAKVLFPRQTEDSIGVCAEIRML